MTLNSSPEAPTSAAPMAPAAPVEPVALRDALRDIVRHPLRTLIPMWSWKAAAWSAGLRAATFFFTNLRAGERAALHALAVEAVFAIVAAGLLGAVSQRLRAAHPVWATALIVWIGMPGLMLLAQALVHHLAGTPHLGTGLLLSFAFAALASAFSWYAMRQGVLLGGEESTTVAHDLRHLPRVLLNFVLAGPRLLLKSKD